MDGNNLRLDLWSFLILISLQQEKYSLLTKARFELRKAITSVISKKLKYLLVSKCCHGKVPFQRYHNDKLNTLGHFTKFTPSITTFAAAVWSYHETRFLPRCVIWSNKEREDYLKHYLTAKKIHSAL